jgi:hypothetical protein
VLLFVAVESENGIRLSDLTLPHPGSFPTGNLLSGYAVEPRLSWKKNALLSNLEGAGPRLGALLGAAGRPFSGAS